MDIYSFSIPYSRSLLKNSIKELKEKFPNVKPILDFYIQDSSGDTPYTVKCPDKKVVSVNASNRYHARAIAISDFIKRAKMG